MLRRLWRWLVGASETPAAPLPRDLVERIEELEDRYRRLTRRFDRMQGEFSALVRYDDADEEDEEDGP